MIILGWAIIILGCIGSFVMFSSLGDYGTTFIFMGVFSSVVLGAIMITLGKISEKLDAVRSKLYDIDVTVSKDYDEPVTEQEPIAQTNTDVVVKKHTKNDGYTILDEYVICPECGCEVNATPCPGCGCVVKQ